MGRAKTKTENPDSLCSDLATPYERFEELTKHLLAVPKEEIDEKMNEEEGLISPRTSSKRVGGKDTLRVADKVTVGKTPTSDTP